MASSRPNTMLARPETPLLNVVRASSDSFRSSWSEKNAAAFGCVYQARNQAPFFRDAENAHEASGGPCDMDRRCGDHFIGRDGMTSCEINLVRGTPDQGSAEMSALPNST